MTTAQEWAADLNAELHAMSDKTWAGYVGYLEDEGPGGVADVWNRLSQETKNIHAGLRGDKFSRPEDKEKRIAVMHELRDIAARRFADLSALQRRSIDDR